MLYMWVLIFLKYLRQSTSEKKKPQILKSPQSLFFKTDKFCKTLIYKYVDEMHVLSDCFN